MARLTSTRQLGFTIYESIASVAIGGTVVTVLALAYANIVKTRLVTKTINEMQFIGEAAQNWHIDNGDWPDVANGCIGAINVLTAGNYLGGAGAASPFGAAFGTACPTPNNFNITLALPSNGLAAEVASGVARSTVAGANLQANFTLPGAVPGLRAYLRRTNDPGFADSNRMQQGLDMNGNPITNAPNISAPAGTEMQLNSDQAVRVTGGPLRVNRGQFSPDEGGSLELGGDNATAGTGTPYIDFHTAGGGVSDFNARIQAPAPNQLSMVASGRISFTTADFDTSGNVTAAGRVRGADVEVGDIGNFSLTRVVQDVRIVENGDEIPKPTCPAGMTRAVNFGAESCSEGPSPSVFYGWGARADNDPVNPNQWLANVRVYTGLGPVIASPGYCRVSSMTFCY